MPTYEYIQSAVNRTPRPRSERLRRLGGTVVSPSVTVAGNASNADLDHYHSNMDALQKIRVSEGYLYFAESLADNGGNVIQELTKAKAGYADQARANADGNTLDWFLPQQSGKLKLNPDYAGLHLTGETLLAGGASVADHLYPSADDSAFLGANSLRWKAINTMTIGSVRYYFSDMEHPGVNYGSAVGFTGCFFLQSEAWRDGGQYAFYGYDYAGLFFVGGGVPLGQAANRWSNVFSVNGDFSGHVTVNRLYLDEHTYLYKDANSNDWHIATDVSGGSVNLIVDGDISCAG